MNSFEYASPHTEEEAVALLAAHDGNTAILAFGLAVVFVFLLLAALYESWLLPLAVVLIVPMCILAAMAGIVIAKLDNNIFVQIGFVEAVLEYIKAGQLPPSTINDVVFEPEAATRLPDKADWAYLDPESSKTTAVLFRKQNYEALQWVTPEDLASSDKLEWLYFIKDGLVYKVSTYDEVKKLSAD